MLANKAIIVKINKDVLLFLFQKKNSKIKKFQIHLFRLPSQKDKYHETKKIRLDKLPRTRNKEEINIFASLMRSH